MRTAGGRAKQLIPELSAEIVRPFGVEVEVSVTDGVPPAVNHTRGVADSPGRQNRCSVRSGRHDRAVAGR